MTIELRTVNAPPVAADRASAQSPERNSYAAAKRVQARPSVCFIGMSNLAVLAPEYDGTGAAGEPVQQTLLARAFARRGYKVTMITGDHGQPDGATWDGVQTYKAFAPDAGLPFVRFVHPRWTGLWSAMRRAAADVYYVSCAGAIVGQVALFCRLHGKRFIYRVASDADCASDTLLIKRWYWRDKHMYQWGLSRASGVLAQSVRQQELLLRNFGVRSTVAGLLVNRPRADASFRARDIDVLWVSNIRELKRPDLLLDLARALPQVHFHMVGGPVPGERSCFESTRARALTQSNVTFHGAVPFREVDSFYSRARVFVNTSDIEGFPNTYLQAWAGGAPVVAFFDPDGLIAKEGLGAAVRTPGEMMDAVKWLARDEVAWVAGRSRCLTFVEREYGEDKVLEPYVHCVEGWVGR